MKPIGTRRPGWRRTFRLEWLESRELLSTLTVTSALDGTPGSLRSVIGAAQGGDVVQFAPALRGAILLLANGEIDITASLTLNGSGQKIDAEQLSRIFHVTGPDVNFSLRNLTLQNGKAPFDPTYGFAGGALFASDASVAFQNCTLQQNTVQSSGQTIDGTFAAPAMGGAVFGENVQLSLQNTVVVANSALGGQNTAALQAGRAMGGAIFAADSTIAVTGGLFAGDTARGGDAANTMTAFPSSFGGYGGGGAIYSFTTDMLVMNTQFVGNQAIGGKGLDGSLAKGPSAEVGSGGEAAGGSIAVNGRQDGENNPVNVTIVGSTFLRDTAQGGDAGAPANASQQGVQGGRAGGGALLTFLDVALTISGSTFDSNRAVGGSAGKNVSGLANRVGWGGVSTGGAVHSEHASLVDIAATVFRNNLAQGGRGSDSPLDGTSNAGAGGWSYGGGLFMLNGRGGAGVDTFQLPVSIRNCAFQNNLARGGDPGQGKLDPIHAGGGAQGGGADFSAGFSLTVMNTSWIGNAVQAGKETMASGGALATAFGADQSTTLIQGGLFLNNRSIGGSDAANVAYREASAGAFMINSPNTTIVGVTFQNNGAIGGADTGSGYAGTGEGGAIFTVGQHPSVTIEACNFLGNYALGGSSHGASAGGGYNGQALGGAIYHTNGDLTIRGGRFVGNFAQGSQVGANRDSRGGAIYASPIDSPPGYDYVTNMYLFGVLFQGNQAISQGASMAAGGAISNAGNILTDIGSRFLQNTARAIGGTAYGGAIYHDYETNQTGTPYVPSATLRGTILTGNQAIGQNVPHGPASQGFGGGIAFVNNPQATLTLTRFQRNRATTAGNDIWGKYHENVD